MWLGPIHDSEFAGRVLKSIENDKEHYGTWARMQGMLTLAESVGLCFMTQLLVPLTAAMQEIPEPFYFTLNRIASHFHSISPPSSMAV